MRRPAKVQIFLRRRDEFGTKPLAFVWSKDRHANDVNGWTASSFKSSERSLSRETDARQVQAASVILILFSNAFFGSNQRRATLRPATSEFGIHTLPHGLVDRSRGCARADRRQPSCLHAESGRKQWRLSEADRAHPCYEIRRVHRYDECGYAASFLVTLSANHVFAASMSSLPSSCPPRCQNSETSACPLSRIAASRSV